MHIMSLVKKVLGDTLSFETVTNLDSVGNRSWAVVT